LKNLLFISTIIAFTSCYNADDVEFVGIENTKVTGTDGQFVKVSIDAILFNPNKVKGKVKSVDIVVLYNNIGVAQVRQMGVAHVKANSKFSIPLEMAVDMQKINTDLLSNLSSIFSNKGIKLHFVGDVKVSIHGIAYKVPIDHIESITF